MQSPVDQPAVAPAAPASPIIVQTVGTPIVATGRFPVPRTVDDLRALRVRREELSNQLISATGRRNDLVRRMANTPAAAQTGLVERIRLLDHRILQIESDISESGEALTAAPSTLLGTSEVPAFARGIPGERTQAVLGMLTIIFVFSPLAIAFAWLLVRRGVRRQPPVEPRESVARLARLEQAVDAIAVEVERVSESQRFLTRVLAEPAAARESLPAGAQREPVH